MFHHRDQVVQIGVELGGPIAGHPLPGQAVLLQPLADNERTLRGVGSVMLVFGGTGVLVAALAGWLVGRGVGEGLSSTIALVLSVESRRNWIATAHSPARTYRSVP